MDVLPNGQIPELEKKLEMETNKKRVETFYRLYDQFQDMFKILQTYLVPKKEFDI